MITEGRGCRCTDVVVLVGSFSVVLDGRGIRRGNRFVDVDIVVLVVRQIALDPLPSLLSATKETWTRRVTLNDVSFRVSDNEETKIPVTLNVVTTGRPLWIDIASVLRVAVYASRGGPGRFATCDHVAFVLSHPRPSSVEALVCRGSCWDTPA